jgi:hypothetical protein
MLRGVSHRSCKHHDRDVRPFPDDAEGYCIARIGLASEMITIGGGAAPLLQIKRTAQPAEAVAA